jgi:hypothetical protein
MRRLVLILFLGLAVTAGAEPAPGPLDLVAEDGMVYRNAQVRRIEPDGLTVSHDGGLTKIPFSRLSDELRRTYEYDPDEAERYRRTRLLEDQKAERDRQALRERLKAERTQQMAKAPVRVFGIRTDQPETRRYRVRFSVRNYGDQPRTVRVEPHAKRLLQGGRTFTIPARGSRQDLEIVAYPDPPAWLVLSSGDHVERHFLHW